MLLPKPLGRAAERKQSARLRKMLWDRTRAMVLARDGYRCRRCRSRAQVDAHHIKFRSAGGDDSPNNVAAICRCCHDEIHAYRLSISGDANKALRFEVLR